jgi:hypothetical protein
MPGELHDTFTFPDEQSGTDTSASAPDLDIQIEDDTPVADRRRTAAEPPDDVSDEELATYDEKVQKRIKRFTRGYHDERRAKESAQREREAAENLARKLFDENKELQTRLSSGSVEYIDQAKKVADSELDAARRQYREAYDSGDADALIAAQEAISKATVKIDRAANLKPLPAPEKDVQFPTQPRIDSRAERWKSENKWFGKNRAASAFALGLHAELVEEKGMDPNSDEYYQAIDDTMREKFPEVIGSSEDRSTSKQDPEPAEDPPRRATKPAAVVAPATRSTSPTRITLKQSEVALAKRLGIPLELYAKKVAELRNGA